MNKLLSQLSIAFCLFSIGILSSISAAATIEENLPNFKCPLISTPSDGGKAPYWLSIRHVLNEQIRTEQLSLDQRNCIDSALSKPAVLKELLTNPDDVPTSIRQGWNPAQCSTPPDYTKLAMLQGSILNLRDWLKNVYEKGNVAKFKVSSPASLKPNLNENLTDLALNRGAAIQCITPAEQQNRVTSKLARALRVRGKTEDISKAVDGTELAALSPATFSVVRDSEAGTTVVDSNLVVGLELGTLVFDEAAAKTKSTAVTAFGSYKAKNTDPSDADDDIERWSFGIAIERKVVDRNWLGFKFQSAFQLDLERVFDKAQDAISTRSDLTWRINPTYRKKGNPPTTAQLCNGYTQLIRGYLLYDCDFRVKANFIHFSQPGNNAALGLAGSNSLLGRGAVLGITLRPSSNHTRLSRFSLSTQYQFITYNRGLLKAIENTSVKLAYQPNKSKNIELALTHARGDDDKTFQYEKKTTLSIAFRY